MTGRERKESEERERNRDEWRITDEEEDMQRKKRENE